MGATSSSTVQDGVDFEDREEYAKWPLQAVKAAYVRLQTERSNRECADLSLTKREFWETFTDYGTIVEGQFLNLPMEQYALFDPENKQSVYALEVFATLALFCNGELPEKLGFIFVMFDFDKSKGISRDEMVMMLRCVTRAMYRVGLTASFPEYEELETLADEMFSEANGGSEHEATVDEILLWASEHIAANDIVSRFSENPHSSLKGIDRKNSMKKYHELHDIEIVEDGNNTATAAGTERSVQRSTKDIVPNHLMTHMRRQVQRVTRMASGREIHRVTTKSLGRGLRKDRKNMLERVATKSCIRELAIQTQFTLSEVKGMRGDFAKFAGEDATLSREAFGKILIQRFPKLTEQKLSLERMYSVFDADGSNSIDFTEFCTGLTRLLKGSADEKLQLLFELYDKNGDGTIGLSELLDVVSESDQTLASEAQFAAQIMQSLDVDGDGAITQDEFVDVLEKEPALMANFSRRISSRTLGSLTDHRTLMTLDDGNQGFTYEGIVSLVQELGKDEKFKTAHANNTVTAWEFKSLMRDHFEISESSVKFFDRLYVMLDIEKNDHVDLRDLLNALVQTLNVNDAQKAAFFFNLYDFDGSGTMDADELLRIILEGQERSGQEAEAFLGMLKKFDTNGDNAIDCGEFRDTILQNPELLQTFGVLFNATGTAEILENALENAGENAVENAVENEGNGGDAGDGAVSSAVAETPASTCTSTEASASEGTEAVLLVTKVSPELEDEATT